MGISEKSLVAFGVLVIGAFVRLHYSARSAQRAKTVETDNVGTAARKQIFKLSQTHKPPKKLAAEYLAMMAVKPFLARLSHTDSISLAQTDSKLHWTEEQKDQAKQYFKPMFARGSIKVTFIAYRVTFEKLVELAGQWREHGPFPSELLEVRNYLVSLAPSELQALIQKHLDKKEDEVVSEEEFIKFLDLSDPDIQKLNQIIEVYQEYFKPMFGGQLNGVGIVARGGTIPAMDIVYLRQPYVKDKLDEIALRVEHEEITQVLNFFVALTPSELQALIKWRMKEDRVGELEFIQFLDFCQDNEEVLKEVLNDGKEAFAVFDTDEDGSISEDELKNGYKILGASEEELKEISALMTSIDLDGDNQISLKEFLIYILSK